MVFQKQSYLFSFAPLISLTTSQAIWASGRANPSGTISCQLLKWLCDRNEQVTQRRQDHGGIYFQFKFNSNWSRPSLTPFESTSSLSPSILYHYFIKSKQQFQKSCFLATSCNSQVQTKSSSYKGESHIWACHNCGWKRLTSAKPLVLISFLNGRGPLALTVFKDISGSVCNEFNFKKYFYSNIISFSHLNLAQKH